MTAEITQRPGRLDLELVRGDTSMVQLTFRTTAGGTVDMSGRTFQLRIVVAGRSSEIDLDDQVNTDDSLTGVIAFTVPAASSAVLVDRARWYLRDQTNLRTLIDGDVRAFPAGAAGAGTGSIEAEVTVTNSTAAVVVTAAVVGPPGEGGGGGGYTQAQIEEFARDAIGAALVAGANITITPNDGANTITIAGTAATVDVVSNVATSTILGRATAGSGDSEELTAAQVRTLLDVLTAAEVAALLDALVDAAPGALDTLNELAAALGDDPNFAATVTAALAGKQPLDADLSAIAALTTTVFGRSLLTVADAAAARTALGLVIGTDVQAFDADLAAVAALTTTAYGRALLEVADLAALRAVLGPTGTPSATTFLNGDGEWATPAGGGSGDVVGPASAVDGRAALYDGTTGKLLKVSTAAPVLEGDSRLTDARTPTAHSHAATEITSGTLDAAQIPSLDASKITSGVLDIGRLATGTPDGTKFVRDDGTLAVPAGGGGGGGGVIAGVGAVATKTVTTTPTSLLASTVTLPALGTGDALMIVGNLDYYNNSGAARFWTFTVRVGSTDVISFVTANNGSSATIRQIGFRAWIYSTGDDAQFAGWTCSSFLTALSGSASGTSTEAMQTAGLALDLRVASNADNSTQEATLSNLVAWTVPAS